MALFWIDEARKTKKTYSELIKDICSKQDIKKYVCYDDPYQVFVELLCSLLIDEPIEIMDASLSEVEIQNLGISVAEIDRRMPFLIDKLQTPQDLIEKIVSNNTKWAVSLYTSGTTGKPKKVAHTFKSLTKNVRQGQRFADHNVWAFAYHPTHFAGLQVFFQAFLNLNSMIYIFDEDKNDIANIFEKYKVTHISATPTFYRTVTPYIKGAVANMKRVTLGGEKFDVQLSETLRNCFPNAKIRNIYASTEAGSLFESENNYFEIKKHIKDHIMVNDDGELLLSSEILGSSDEFKVIDGWYFTGDIVRLIDDTHIEFIGRKTEMINVGGYKVNPQEIEEEIKKIDGVIDVTVRARANKLTGNIIIADVIKNDDAKNIDETYILQFLIKTLQSWKIPRMIKFVSEIDKTRTGKKVRI
jgi:acyl-coenzyme A synthetase/AMP-(fatty) acid ligase